MKRYRNILATIVFLGFWFGINEEISNGYTYNVWINIDELANALLYGDNETLSERWGKAELEGSYIAAGVCDVLDVFFKEDDHCVNSIGD